MARVIVKVGSSSLTSELGVVDIAMIENLCRQVEAVRAEGHQVVVVSSGAVAAGVAALGLQQRPTDLPTLQALAALGQPRMIETWIRALAVHGAVAAQVLLVPHDFVNRRQYLHARQTLVRLLELGCVPVVNENDAIADDQIRFGDNDRLAALVAHLVSADVLVLLTDLDGLYTADPRRDAGAELIAQVAADDPIMGVIAGGPSPRTWCRRLPARRRPPQPRPDGRPGRSRRAPPTTRRCGRPPAWRPCHRSRGPSRSRRRSRP